LEKLSKSWWAVILLSLFLTGISGYPANAQAGIKVDRQLPFPAALQVADQVIEAVNRKGSLPDSFQLLYSDGQTEQISAAQALGLLAGAGESLRQGKVSALPLFPPETGAPAVSVNTTSAKAAALFSTGAVLNQARGVLDFTLAMGAFPSAVWIGGERIASGDYLVSLAAILRFAAETLELPEQVQIITYRSPGSWITQQKKPSSVVVPPVKPPAPAPPAPAVTDASPLPSPTLEIIPKAGARLQGKVNIVAALSPPTTYANVTISLDGRPLLHSNWPPFVLSLDTAELTQGEHKIKVEVVNGQGELLVSREIKILVEPEVQGAPDDSGEAAENPN
jgi:hypothetical protein